MKLSLSQVHAFVRNGGVGNKAEKLLLSWVDDEWQKTLQKKAIPETERTKGPEEPDLLAW